MDSNTRHSNKQERTPISKGYAAACFRQARMVVGALFCSSLFLVAGELNASLDKGIRAHWTFEAGSGNVAVDTVDAGGRSDATLVNGAKWRTDGRDASTVIEFPASDSADYRNFSGLRIKSGADINAPGDFSITFWYSMNKWGRRVLMQKGPANGSQMTVMIDGSYLRIQGIEIHMPTLKSNEWVHVAYVYQKEKGLEQIFINGQQLRQRGGRTISFNDHDLTLGFGEGYATATAGLLLDDLKIFHRALDPLEVPIIAGLNQKPVALDLSLAVTAGDATRIELGGFDLDGGNVTFNIAKGPASGSLEATDVPNVFLYRSKSGFTGSDSITYTVSDGTLASEAATVNLSVLAASSLRAASPLYTVAEDGFVEIDLGAGTSHTSASFEIVAQPSHGRLSGVAPVIGYTPANDFYGIDQFTYRLTDASGRSAEATVYVQVLPENDAPRLAEKVYATLENQVLEESIDWSDPEFDSASLSLVEFAKHGTAELKGEVLVYTPSTGFRGVDHVTVVATDERGASSTRQYRIVVSGDKVYNVKDFGAAGNNQVDDTRAANAALDAAAKFSGGTVYFPQGTYKVITKGQVTLDMYGRHAGAWALYSSEIENARLANWRFENARPVEAPAAGINFHLDRSTGIVWKWDGAQWISDGHLIDGRGTGWQAGHGAPDKVSAQDGDVYLKFYVKFERGQAIFLVGQQHNNTTFKGDGAANSILSFRTWGDRDPMDYEVDTASKTVIRSNIARGKEGGYIRGSLFVMMSNSTAAFNNITWDGLRLSGNTRATGSHGWWTEFERLHEWDITNKAIILPTDYGTARNITIKNCELDGWRGEIIYKGGGNHVEVRIEDSKLSHSNGSAISTSAICIVDRSELWDVYNGFENYALPGQYTEIRNTLIDVNRTVRKDGGDYGVVFLGDPNEHLLIENSEIRNAGNAAIFLSDFAHNVTVRGNLIEDCPIGLYAIYLNLYQKPSAFINILLEENRFYARNRSSEAFVTSFIGGPANDWVIRKNEIRGFNGHAVQNIVRSQHSGPWHWLKDFIVEDNIIYDGGLVGDPRGFRPLLKNNVVASGRQGVYYNSFGGSVSSPGTIFPTWNVVVNDIEGEGKIIKVGDMNKFPVGFEFSIFSTQQVKGAEFAADPSWNNFKRGYMVYAGSELKLRFNEQGVFELVSYTPRPGTPLVVKTGSEITFRGYDSVTLDPSSPTVFNKISGLPRNHPVTIHYNANVTIAHTRTDNPQPFQISTPGAVPFAPGKAGSVRVMKGNDDVVYFLPEINSVSAVGEINEFGSTTITSSVFGSGPLTYQWYRGNVGDTSSPVAGANSASLPTGSIQGVGTANYWLRVSSPVATVDSKQVSITVKPVAPSVTELTEDHEVAEFSNTVLAVGAIGTSPMSYQWYRGERGDVSQPIADATAVEVELSKISGLGVQKFWVRVSNNQGSVDSPSVSVDVKPIAPVIEQIAGERAVEEFQAADLSASAYGSGSLAYQWYRGQSGDTSAPVSSAVVATFQTPSLLASSINDFWVRVQSPYGTTDSETVSVSIKPVKPVVTSISGGTAVTEFQNASLQVSAIGSGELKYQWYQKGPSGDVALQGQTGSTLSLAQISGIGTHSYYAVISNDHGSVSTSPVQVTVNAAPPAIVQASWSQQVFDGESASISVTASGSAGMQYHWEQRKAGAAWVSAGNSTAPSFRSGALSFGSDWEFRVRVVNAGGEVTSQVMAVNVQPQPIRIVSQPKGGSLGPGLPLVLSVQAQGNGQLSYAWYKDSAPIAGANASVLEVREMSAEAAGAYRCLVSNGASSVWSDTANVTFDTRTQWILLDAGDEYSPVRWGAGSGAEARGAAEAPVMVVSDLYLGRDNGVLAFSSMGAGGRIGSMELPENHNLASSILYFRFRLPEGADDAVSLALVTDEAESAEAISLIVRREGRDLAIEVCGHTTVLPEATDGWTDVWLLVDNQLDQAYLLALPGTHIAEYGIDAQAIQDMTGPIPFCAPVESGFSEMVMSVETVGEPDTGAVIYLDNLSYLPQGQTIQRPFAVTAWEHIPTHATGYKHANIGWIYDGYFPWIWHGDLGGWLYLYDGSVLTNLWFYYEDSATTNTCIWTSEDYNGWHFYLWGDKAGWSKWRN